MSQLGVHNPQVLLVLTSCGRYPHVTDTVNGVKTKEESIHLTLGVDT